MRKQSRSMLLLVCGLPVLCGFAVPDCGLIRGNFEPISLNGFDATDNAQDWNDYPWSMTYFVPDGASDGYVYVGTGNGIDEQVRAVLGLFPAGESPYRPPEIRRYRPDLGVKTWERVFDFRDVEQGPNFTSTGFRNMAVYRAQSDGVNYLYASTFGTKPTVWRSATGEPGSWQAVWSSETEGSIRWLAPHRGILYIAIANDVVTNPTPGQIWATDGATVWPVMRNGFGNPANRAVMSLRSYNGWLYAGTANDVTGFEVWRLEGPETSGVTPVKVIGDGGTDPQNQAAGMLYVFRDKLYVGSMILGGFRMKGCILLRLDQNDAWEVIVGPNSLSGYAPGFDNGANAYLWWMEEHDGWLYAGTWDLASVLPLVMDNLSLLGEAIPALLNYIQQLSNGTGKASQTPLSELVHGGADLYKSADGTHWIPVFLDGLGDPYNYGVRTMVSVGDTLYLGMANPFDGLEIWRGQRPAN